MRKNVTVAIPVGPNNHHCLWLPDALESVYKQTYPAEVLIVDDMHGLTHPWEDETPASCPVLETYALNDRQAFVRDRVFVWRSPWRLGVAHAFNFGVALAQSELVVMLGADDTLEPNAVELAVAAYEADGKLGGRTYYGFPVRYMDTGEVQTDPCNEAMVSKTLWRRTGGFPPEAAIGACDTIFLSSIWKSDYFRIQIVGSVPLCNYRRHSATDSATRSPAWQGPIFTVRDLLSPVKPPEWGRYE